MIGSVNQQSQMAISGRSSLNNDPKESVAEKTYHTKVMGQNIGDILSKYEEVDKAKIAKKQSKIDDIDTRVQNLANLEEKVAALSKAASHLFGKGVGAREGGAFSELVPVKVSGPDDVIIVTADKNASPVEIDIEVRQLARKDSIEAAQGHADRTAALGWTGSFDVHVLGTDAQTIQVTADMSLDDVMHAVNGTSGASHIQANIINLPTESRLVFKAFNYAEPLVVDTTNLNGNGDENAAHKIPTSSLKTVEDLSAKVRYDGIPVDVLYSTNKIPAGDQYPGIDISLASSSEGNPVKVSLQNDRNAAGNAILEFVEAFNAYQDFTASEEMYKGGRFKGALDHLSAVLTEEASHVGEGKLKTLHDAGIKLEMPRDDAGKLIPQSKSLLKVDISTLTTALEERFDEVSALFGFSQTTSNHHFKLSNTPKGLSYGDVEVNFTKKADNSYEASFSHDGTTYEATLMEGVGNIFTLRAPDHSPLKGMMVIYNNASSLPDHEENTQTSVISMSQGITDKVAKTLQGLLDPLKGEFKQERDSLESSKLTQQTKLNEEEVRLAVKREHLFRKFQDMEIAVNLAKQTQNFIKNVMKAAQAA